MAGQRQVIHRHVLHIDLDLPRRLHRIAMEQHPARLANLRNLLHREQHPRFIVRPHQRHHRRGIRDRVLQARQIQQPVPVNGKIGDAVGRDRRARRRCFGIADGPAVCPYLFVRFVVTHQRHAIIQHRGMLHRRSDYMPLAGRFQCRMNRRIIVLRRARRENHLARVRPDQFCQMFPCHLDHALELRPELVRTKTGCPIPRRGKAS